MDQEPELGPEPLDPPTREEEEAEAWEYWHQRAHAAEAKAHAAEAKAHDLLAALWDDDPDMPDAIRPLSWLRSMIEFCELRIPQDTHDDPDALWTMVQEVKLLHERATAAVAKATGAQS